MEGTVLPPVVTRPKANIRKGRILLLKLFSFFPFLPSQSAKYQNEPNPFKPSQATCQGLLGHEATLISTPPQSHQSCQFTRPTVKSVSDEKLTTTESCLLQFWSPYFFLTNADQ